ncbi:MAG: S1 RNA-binding domain-containing protein [Candidatus Gastranaerophilales bacterium]|nr:S1 RNA-binding domain-containing protein [Candidatus Gastranaerophilales bacterium]
MGSIMNDEDFESLLNQYDYAFKRGDLVKGTVCGYDSEGAIVDIGGKAAAVVPEKEASTDGKKVEAALEKGKEYEFLIISDVDDNGKFLLSRKKVDLFYAWQELKKLKEANEIIKGEIVQVVRGGLLVDIIGVRGFIPSSQIQDRTTEYAVGDKIEVKIISLDEEHNNFVLSNKKIYSDSIENAKEEIFSQIEVGQVIKGRVVRVTDFGAFIDIGGFDCLLPLSQISWKWVEHPTDLLKIGEEIEVGVFDVDAGKQRITLSLKSITPDPWEAASKEIKEGDFREGLITRIKPFGAFVEIYDGVEALLPHNELIEYQNTNNVILEAGAKIKVCILKFNPQDKRISLGFNPPEEA